MKAPTLFTLALLAASLLAGCSQGPGGPSGLGDSGPRGVIEGLVLDEEVRPLEGVRVALPELTRNVTTGPDGKFRFDKIPPGTYKLQAELEGYDVHEREVVITQGRALVLNVVLSPIPHHVGHLEIFPFVGIQRCMWYTPSFKAGCTFPYIAVTGTLRDNGVNASEFGAPEDVQENQYRYNFTVRPGHTGIVSELAWSANTEASSIYVLELSCAWYNAAVDDCVAPGQTTWDAGNTYARARGVSPLRIEWEHERPDWMPWVMARAYLSGDASRPVGVALDQRVDMMNTVFYGGEIPDDYALLTEE